MGTIGGVGWYELEVSTAEIKLPGGTPIDPDYLSPTQLPPIIVDLARSRGIEAKRWGPAGEGRYWIQGTRSE